jgi:ABC-type Mn2+/Zn2+ transport system ATPase subunit
MSAAVSARGLSVGYEGKPVVASIDLAVEKGSTLALVGVNGSGKSTLLKTVVGLLPAVGGALSVLGERPGRAAPRIAYLGQFHPSQSVLPFRAIDVVRMARFSVRGLLAPVTREDEALVRAAMERMGVAALANAPLNALSGGQRQRVFLAQALARDAELLLFDEPHTNLDAAGAETFRDALRDAVTRGATAIVATHDIEDAAACDNALLLAQRVVAYGPGTTVLTPQALMETFGVAIRMGGENMVIAERAHRHECRDEGEP